MQRAVESFDDSTLQLFYLDLIQKLSSFLLVFCLLVPWALLPQPDYPYRLLPYFISLALVAVLAKHYAGRGRLQTARFALVFGLAGNFALAVLLLRIPWLPYLSIPVMSVVGLLAGYGLSLLFGGILLAAVGLANLWSPVYPTWELLFVMLTGFAVNLLTLGTLTTAVSWYKTSQDRSDDLLSLTREHRAELAHALKSLQLSNTLLQKTQQELIAARWQAERARQMKEQFAANISHELRTPLNLILGFGKIIYLSPEVYGEMEWPPTLRHDVHQIYKSSQHLSELIDDILDLSHFEMTGYSLQRTVVNMTSFLHESVGILMNLFRASPVPLYANIPDDLPQIEIDATRIRQVLINLVTNAYRHTTQGCITMSATSSAHEIEISVRDTGSGISPDQLAHIFEQFYQVDASLSRKHGGVGIGLTLSRQFVESHGGRIHAESALGIGSTFCFTLPVTPALLGRKDDQQAALAGSPQRPSILLLDEDGRMHRMLRRRIDQYQWIQITDWRDISQALHKHQPRAVVANLPSAKALPPVLEEIRVPLLVCNFQMHLVVGETAPFRKLLLKPVDIAVLAEEIRAAGSVRDILVVDDDRAFIQLVQRMVASINPAISVRRAYDITEAIVLLEKAAPDLILADVVMPTAGGVELIEQMRRDGRYLHIPVILLTAGAHEHAHFKPYDTTLSLHSAAGLTPNSLLKYLAALLAEIGPYAGDG